MEQRQKSSSPLGIIISVIALVIASLAYMSSKKAEDAAKNAVSEEKIKTTVIEIVKQDPQLLMNAMGEGIAKKREDTVKQLAVDVYKQKDDIIKQSLKFGKADSKSVVICFFDPMCKHCIAFQKSMASLIKSKKDVAFKMLPVGMLGDDSYTLARVYFSVYEKSQEKALKFIEKLTEDGGAMDKDAIEKALKVAGLSYKEIESTLNDSEKKLIANGKLAETLKLPFVPAIFLIKGSNVTMAQSTSVDDLLKFIDSKEDVAPTAQQPAAAETTKTTEAPKAAEEKKKGE